MTSGLALVSRRVNTSSPCGAKGAAPMRFVRSFAVLSAMACPPVAVLRSIWALATLSQAAVLRCGRSEPDPSIANDWLQFFGVFDPALDRFGLRQQADHLAVIR